MSSLSLDIFHRLLSQAHELEATAIRAEEDGFGSVAPILRRSGYILAVAAFDSYFHERAIQLLTAHARVGGTQSSKVAKYVTHVSATDVSSPEGESHVRLGLSFQTLVAPHALDKLFTAIGRDPDAIWLAVALSLNTRPDRLRRLLELLYDRRNQIAHEADWDVGRLDFRPMEKAHLSDCVRHVTEMVEQFDAHL